MRFILFISSPLHARLFQTSLYELYDILGANQSNEVTSNEVTTNEVTRKRVTGKKVGRTKNFKIV